MTNETTTRDGVPLTFRSGPSDPYSVTDEPGTWAEVVVAAPPEVVWALVSDINLPARFSQEFLGADWVDDRRGVGASFVGRNQMDALGEWEVPSFVEVHDEGRAFGWKTVDPDSPGSRWRFDLSPEGDGTRLRYTASMGPGFSFL
ncbi:MAG: SRPBCC family protein, partial [Actinomycetes bacterium]